MKTWHIVKFPLLALAIVGAFWVVVLLAQRQFRQSRSESAPGPSPATPAAVNPLAAGNVTPNAPGGASNQGVTPAATDANPEDVMPSNAVGGGAMPNDAVAPSNPLAVQAVEGETQAPGMNRQSPGQGSTGIVVNGRELTPQVVEQLRGLYGYVAPPGRYWYDPRGGLFGVIGREAAGFMRPGHNFGQLPPNASNGNTGVFINGRQINRVEAAYLQRLFGAVYQGRWWLDGTSGNIGMEGNPMPVANVFMALQQSQRGSGGGSGGNYSWHSNVTGASGGSSGGCSYVSIPGSGSVMTGNCD